jgi:putative FmdB family regulatory protein
VPTYEYACGSCGNRYEKREGFDAPARQKCPKCSKVAQRLLSTPAVVFKGSGFYKTDNRGSSGGASSTSSENGESSTPTPAAEPAGSHGHGPDGHTHDAPKSPPPATTEPAAAS